MNKEFVRGYVCQEADQRLQSAQKEYTRQHRQRDKAERKNQRKREKAVEGSLEEVAELHQHAVAQAALLNVGQEEADTRRSPLPVPALAVTRDCRSAGA